MKQISILLTGLIIIGMFGMASAESSTPEDFENPLVKQIQFDGEIFTIYSEEQYNLTVEITNYDVTQGELDFLLVPTTSASINNLGEITWTPTQEELGKQYIAVYIVNTEAYNQNKQAEALYTIYFNVIERPTSIPIVDVFYNDEIIQNPSTNLQYIHTDTEYTYQLNVSNYDLSELDITYLSIPNITLDGTTGQFTWTPTEDEVGEHRILFLVDVLESVIPHTTTVFDMLVSVEKPVEPKIIADTVTPIADLTCKSFPIFYDDTHNVSVMQSFNCKDIHHNSADESLNSIFMQVPFSLPDDTILTESQCNPIDDTSFSCSADDSETVFTVSFIDITQIPQTMYASHHIEILSENYDNGIHVFNFESLE